MANAAPGARCYVARAALSSSLVQLSVGAGCTASMRRGDCSDPRNQGWPSGRPGKIAKTDTLPAVVTLAVKIRCADHSWHFNEAK